MGVALGLVLMLMLGVGLGAGLAGVRRVAVVGAGPGGLCLALALRRLGGAALQVSVFEGRADAAQTGLGGGLQLSGGARVLELLGVLPQLRAVALPLARVLGRNAERQVLLDLDAAAAVRASGQRDLLASDSAPLLLSVMREALQGVLLAACLAPPAPHEAAVEVRTSMRLASMRTAGVSGKYELSFAGGETEADFDMVFGCDGVASRVRESIYMHSDAPALSPRYSGLRVGYAVTASDPSFSLRPEGRDTFHQWFGDGLYALEASYGGAHGPQHMLALVYRDARDAALGENAAWSDEPLLGRLGARLQAGGLGAVPELSTLLGAAEPSRCVDLGVREAFAQLPAWSSADGRVVLLGDSAHAMAPFLGQGANQALQDAYVLARAVARLNEGPVDRAALKRMCAEYEGRRRTVTTQLRLKSGLIGQLETLGGPLGAPLKEAFFRFASASGIAKSVFLDAATPRI